MLKRAHYSVLLIKDHVALRELDGTWIGQQDLCVGREVTAVPGNLIVLEDVAFVHFPCPSLVISGQHISGFKEQLLMEQQWRSAKTTTTKLNKTKQKLHDVVL